MITVAHDAPKGKLKWWAITIASGVLVGVLVTVIAVMCKKPLHALEQAMS